jgi:hypothetical protein
MIKNNPAEALGRREQPNRVLSKKNSRRYYLVGISLQNFSIFRIVFLFLSFSAPLRLCGRINPLSG